VFEPYLCSSPDDANSEKVAENGSGGFMSDLTFIGGAIGIRMLSY
jgi:hypothetical protein